MLRVDIVRSLVIIVVGFVFLTALFSLLLTVVIYIGPDICKMNKINVIPSYEYLVCAQYLFYFVHMATLR